MIDEINWESGITELDMTSLFDFYKKTPESEEKKLLLKAYMELKAYRNCGTVQECESRKEWMSLSLDDIRENLHEFMRQIREEHEWSMQKRKRGRPRKKEEDGE